MNLSVKFILLIAATALVSASAFFFFPDVKAADVELAVFIAFSASISQLLAVWYFLSSLRAFQRGLKIAYYWLSAGIFLFGGVMLVPSLSVFTAVLGKSQVATDAAIITPYALGALCMYIGMRTFMRLLGVRSRASSPLIALAFAGVLAGIVVLLPHPSEPGETEWLFDLTFGAVAWCGAFAVSSLVVALKVKRAIGILYKRAMLWVVLALAALSFTAFHEMILKMYFLNSGYAASQLSLLSFLIVGLLFLRAGIAFRATSRESIPLPANATFIDIVVGAAELVSKPDEVDEALDKVRTITTQQSTELSKADKQALGEVYLHIEDYLLTKELLHKFTKDGLRNNLPEDFLREIGARPAATV